MVRLAIRGTVLGMAIILAGPTSAQQSAGEQRAAQALQSVPQTGQIITNQNMSASVTPFVTAAPPESTLTPNQLQTETILRRFSPSAEARAMTANEDSFLGRPNPGVTTADVANADSAVANAMSTVGGYFDPVTGGLCQYSDFGSVGTFKRLCDRYPSFDVNQCTISRVVSIDRWDTWTCDKQTPTFQDFCDETPSLACNMSASCYANSITFTLPSNWSESGPGDNPVLTSSRPAAGSCRTRDQSFSFDVSSDWQIQSASLQLVGHSQYTQVHLNGTILGTYPNGGTGGVLYKRSTSFLGIFFRREGPAIGTTYLSTSCNANWGTSAANLDITRYLAQPQNPGLGQVTTARNTLRVISVGTAPAARLTLRFNGPCCDGLSLTKVKTCAPVTR